TSGRLKKGWALTAAGAYKAGNGWVEQTNVKAFFLYIKVDKMWGKHLTSLTGFGAPQTHVDRSYKRGIADYDSTIAKKLGITSSEIPASFSNQGIAYNSQWGYIKRDADTWNSDQTARIIDPNAPKVALNGSVNTYFKPQYSLRDSWNVSDKLLITNIIYLSTGSGGGTRPRTREEMKQALGDGSGFYNIGAYRAEVASRLFGGEELFREVCEFLKMGKAYREISARAGDYHELFKSLLPEPKTEMFERIIKAMKDLDGSRVDLDKLECKSIYLHELEALIKAVDNARDDKLRYAWLVQSLRVADFVAHSGVLETDVMRLQDELTTLCHSEADKKQELLGMRRLLGDLQTKDVRGLVRQEKDCTADLAGTESMIEKRQADLVLEEKRRRELQKQWNKGRELFTEKLRKLHSELGVMASGLTFPITELLTALDTAYRAELSIDPLVLMKVLPISAMINQSEMELSLVRTKMAQRESKLAELQNHADSATLDCEKLEKQAETMPEVHGFHAALLRLRNSMLDVQPLYKGLEWKIGLTQSTMSAVEEMIGDAVLGTLLVPERDWDVTRELIYSEFPDLRVAQLLQKVGFGMVEIPAWIHENFDIAKSNPLAIECLAREMEAQVEPHDKKWKQWHVGLLRTHERLLQNKSPRLIGIERRRQEWHRQVQHLRRDR
ncbi:MAG: hypothetical protein WCP55_18135, partial [Lentisphaerota bacterium]